MKTLLLAVRQQQHRVKKSRTPKYERHTQHIPIDNWYVHLASEEPEDLSETGSAMNVRR